MAQSIEPHVTNPASRLRSALERLERLATQPTAETVEALLTGLDAAEVDFAALEAEGVDLRAERVRWGNMTARLRSRPQIIARAAASRPGGMDALRRAHPPAAGFWWHTDEERSRRIRRAWAEVFGILAGVALLLGGGYFIFIRLFPPDPAAVALVQTTAEISTALATDDWAAARAHAEEGFAAWPDEPEMAMWAAVLADHDGDEARADAAFAVALNALDGDALRFWLLQSEVRQSIGDAAGGLAAADEALALAPESAEAHFFKGKAAVMADDRETALAELDRAYQLAGETNPQLAINARVLWGELMQQGPAPQLTPGLTPSPATAP